MYTAAARVRRTAINVVDVSDVTMCQNMVDVSDVKTCQNIRKVSENIYPDKILMWRTDRHFSVRAVLRCPPKHQNTLIYWWPCALREDSLDLNNKNSSERLQGYSENFFLFQSYERQELRIENQQPTIKRKAEARARRVLELRNEVNPLVSG